MSDAPPTPWHIRCTIWLYEQQWCHWVVSILAGCWDTFFGVFYRAWEHFYPASLWKEWQGRPSPPYPIPLTENDVPVKTERCDCVGQYIATIVTYYADAAELQSILPPNAELDPAHIHDGKHAIIYLFGYTENLHRVWNPFKGINYMEFAIGIPNIRIKPAGGYDFPFFYLPMLYLSRLYPVILGLMVGYRKHWGWVHGKDTTYKVGTLGGKSILSASFEVDKQPPMLMGGPNAGPWRELLDQPHANHFGPADFLFLHYHWDWKDALLQPVTADVEVFAPLPGLAPGKYHFEPLNMGAWVGHMAPTGAFRLVAPFELLSPFGRDKLLHYNPPQPEPPAAFPAAHSN